MAFPWLFLISVAAGLVGAISGMGGGVVLIPALTLLGIDIMHAIAVSIVSVIATSSGSAAAYVRDRITNLKVGMFLEMFTIVGALVGAAVTLASGHSILFILFGVVLLASWGALFLGSGTAGGKHRREGEAKRGSEGDSAITACSTISPSPPLPLAPSPPFPAARTISRAGSSSKAAITTRLRTKPSGTARSGPTRAPH